MAPRHLQQASTTVDRSLPFQIRGTNLTLLTLKLTDPEAPDFFGRLAASLSIAPGFYRNAPLILDLTGVTDLPPVDLGAFCAELRALALTPVGFVGATADWEQAALAAGLSVFPAGRATDSAATKGRGAPLPRRATARMVPDPVRSGQQVYAPHADLIVMAPVSRGAELLADGNIHVYGCLRGRALAGMNGDASARIFCRELDADLVSIAGFYMVSEQMDPQHIGKSVQIRLDGERLVFEPL